LAEAAEAAEAAAAEAAEAAADPSLLFFCYGCG